MSNKEAKKLKRKIRLAKNEIKRTDNTTILYGSIFDLNDKGIFVTQLTPYQYRLFNGSRTIDYYPTASKYHNITENKRGVIKIENITDLFV
jgi:hypothetical protein